MKVGVRYFASVREALGPFEALEMPAGSTVGAVRDALIARSDAHARALGRDRAARSALNQVMCDDGTVVADGAEVAFFPPVTGG